METLSNVSFDVEGARSAGYSDAEIADYLSTQSGLDLGGVRTAGYSDRQILQLLSAPVPRQPTGAPARADGFPWRARK